MESGDGLMKYYALLIMVRVVDGLKLREIRIEMYSVLGLGVRIKKLE